MSKSIMECSVPWPITLCGVPLRQILIFESKLLPCGCSSCEEHACAQDSLKLYVKRSGSICKIYWFSIQRLRESCCLHLLDWFKKYIKK